jgi:hypothetical protein
MRVSSGCCIILASISFRADPWGNDDETRLELLDFTPVLLRPYPIFTHLSRHSSSFPDRTLSHLILSCSENE